MIAPILRLGWGGRAAQRHGCLPHARVLQLPHTSQRLAKFGSGREACIGLFRQRRDDHCIKLLRHLRTHVSDRGNRIYRVARHGGLGVGCGIRQLTGEHLVQHAP